MTAYSMTQFGGDVLALMDHLGLHSAIVGGTSLGANTALEVAVAAPERVKALVLEMPVLENGLAGAAALFVPLALSIRVNRRGMRVLSKAMRLIPRSHFMVDLMLDFVRRDPEASLAVLDGVTFGRVAPPIAQRRQIRHKTLVIGHTADPIHPFSDADDIARELPNARLVQARSIAEWRLRPDRLDGELAAFLDEVWAEPRLRAVAGY
jgi:pimeloyl-ACP methyl ester carboxylesterase